MPSLAARSCAVQGCRQPARNGSRCKDHERERQVNRGTTAERGYDSDHNRLRVLAFKRDNWTCVDCGWRPTIVVDAEQCGIDEPPAQIILESLRVAYARGERHLQGDHIVPIEVSPDLRLNLDNYSTKCNVCHNRKGQRY